MNASATLIRSINTLLGDPNNPTTQRLGFGTFDTSSKYDDYNPMKLFSAITNNCFPASFLDEIMATKQTSTQEVYVDVLQRTPSIISSNLIQTGFGNIPITARVPMLVDQLIAAKIRITRDEVAVWDHYFKTYAEKFKAALAFAMYDGYRQIIDQMATRAVAYLEANKSSAGGLGTFYPPNGAFKEIPALEENFVRETYGDSVRGNNWADVRDKHYLLGNLQMDSAIDDLNQLALYNERNAATQLNHFKFLSTKKITPTSNLYKVAFYAVEGSGLYYTTWIPPQGDMPEDVLFDQKTITSTVMPGNLFDGVGPINVAVYKNKDQEDNFLTTNLEESRLNQTLELTMATWCIFGRSYSSVANQQTINKYQILA